MAGEQPGICVVSANNRLSGGSETCRGGHGPRRKGSEVGRVSGKF